MNEVENCTSFVCCCCLRCRVCSEFEHRCARRWQLLSCTNNWLHSIDIFVVCRSYSFFNRLPCAHGQRKMQCNQSERDRKQNKKKNVRRTNDFFLFLLLLLFFFFCISSALDVVRWLLLWFCFHVVRFTTRNCCIMIVVVVVLGAGCRRSLMWSWWPSANACTSGARVRYGNWVCRTSPLDMFIWVRTGGERTRAMMHSEKLFITSWSQRSFLLVSAERDFAQSEERLLWCMPISYSTLSWFQSKCENITCSQADVHLPLIRSMKLHRNLWK